MDTINVELCSNCGGLCCKKSGCDYSPSDFKDLSTNGILKILEEGHISIVAIVNISYLPNGKKTMTPFLYLRARNINREVVDLFSMKTTCSMLTETGCSYDVSNRPSGGLNLVPVKEINPETGRPLCYPKISPFEIIKPWESYQKPLSKVVKRLTGMTIEQKFIQDLENTIYDILTDNTEGVSPIELNDIASAILNLVEIYPEVYKEACKRTGKTDCVLTLKPR